MTNKKDISNKAELQQFNNFVLFTAENGKVNIDVYFQDETLCLSQKRMAELFEVDRSVITKHLKNIFESNELAEGSVCANFAHTAEDGKTYTTKYYNLKAITAVGYRVNSHRATEFRKWATNVLHKAISNQKMNEYIKDVCELVDELNTEVTTTRTQGKTRITSEPIQVYLYAYC